MQTVPQPKEAIREIVDWTINYYDDGKGGLPRSVKEDGTMSKERLFNDLGDYLPFFAYLGQKDFCLKQLKDTEEIIQKNGLLPPEFRYVGLPCTRSYEHTDLLLGLIDAYKFFPSYGLHSLIERIANGVLHAYYPKNNKPSSWFFPTIGYRLPILDYKDGMFIEIWTTLSKTFSEPRYLDIAKQFSSTLLEFIPTTQFPLTPNLVGTSVFGSLIANKRFASITKRYTPMKYLSNTAYGILEIYNATLDPSYRQILEKIKKKIEQFMIDEKGYVHECLLEEKFLKKIKPIHLVQNFPIMDWSADCAYFLHDDSFLDLAKRIAEPWLSQQNPDTGLIAQFGDQDSDPSTDLDTLTDTAIAFYKISEISGEKKYSEASRRIVQGILQHHRRTEKSGYVLSVNAKTGEILNSEIKIKFNCLFLKALIVLERNTSIYQTDLYELTKDR